MSAGVHVNNSVVQKSSHGFYQKGQTRHVVYFMTLNTNHPNSVIIVDETEYIRIALQTPRTRRAANFTAQSPELTNGSPRSPLWQSRYDRFVSSMIEKTSIKKFVIVEKRKANKFPSAPVSLLLADVDELMGEEHDWNPVNYYEEVQPFAIRRSSLKRFPVLAFESGDADLIAESLNSVVQSCQNDR